MCWIIIDGLINYNIDHKTPVKEGLRLKVKKRTFIRIEGRKTKRPKAATLSRAMNQQFQEEISWAC